MGWIAAGGLALGLGSSIFKGIKAGQQQRQADAIQAQDPGYQVNQSLIDNAKTLSDKYNNYVMPGYAQAQQNLNNSFGTAMAQARQGATSGGDILDAGSKLNYNLNNAENNLGVANAQGKEALLPQVINANSLAGNEQVLKNAYNTKRFDEAVAAKAALTNASNQNAFSALDEGLKGVNSFLTYKSQNGWGGGSKTGQPAGSVSSVSGLGSLFDSYASPGIFDSGLSTVNGYSSQKKKAAAAGLIQNTDINSYA